MRIALHVSRTEFADTLGAMRQWLDNNKCPEVRFETATEPDAILINIELPDIALGAAFLQAFDPIAASA